MCRRRHHDRPAPTGASRIGLAFDFDAGGAEGSEQSEIRFINRKRQPRSPVCEGALGGCDRLRGSVESAEYKHLVLGLLFLKYISDSFERRRAAARGSNARPEGSDLFTEDDDGARGDPRRPRRVHLRERLLGAEGGALGRAAGGGQPARHRPADRPGAGGDRDEPTRSSCAACSRASMRAPRCQPQKLGELVTTIAKVGFGDDEDKARDILGRTYEYFIKQFAAAEGHRGGEFYTPRSVTRLLVEMLEPYEGRVLDPACGSCGLFIQSAEFVKSHGGNGPRDLDLRPGEQPGDLAHRSDEPRDPRRSPATSGSGTACSTTSTQA